MGMSLAELRKDYMRQSLSEADVKPDPFEQFSIWFEQALSARWSQLRRCWPQAFGISGRAGRTRRLLRRVI